MAEARTCYDHLAGKLGVGLYGALVDSGALLPGGGMRGEVRPGPTAEEVFGRMGLDLQETTAEAGRRRFAFACPDWTERVAHLGGALGAAVCARFFQEGWVSRREGSRAITLTDAGRRAVREHFGLEIGET